MPAEGGRRTLSLQPKRQLESRTEESAPTQHLAFARAALPIAQRPTRKNKGSRQRESTISSWLGLHGRLKPNLVTAMPAGPIELPKQHRTMGGQERKRGEERGRHNACLGYRRARSHSMQ